MYKRQTYDAAVIGGDEDYDIAVIKVEGTNFQPVVIGKSGSVQILSLIHIFALIGVHVSFQIVIPLREVTSTAQLYNIPSVNTTIVILEV